MTRKIISFFVSCILFHVSKSYSPPQLTPILFYILYSSILAMLFYPFLPPSPLLSESSHAPFFCSFIRFPFLSLSFLYFLGTFHPFIYYPSFHHSSPRIQLTAGYSWLSSFPDRAISWLLSVKCKLEAFWKVFAPFVITVRKSETMFRIWQKGGRKCLLILNNNGTQVTRCQVPVNCVLLFICFSFWAKF